MFRCSNNNLARRGFTLLELLMVIAIISIMLTLSVIVMSGLLGSAKEEATSATIQKANRLLEQRVDAFNRAFNGARRTQYMKATYALLADPNRNGNSDDDGIFGVREEVVEILARKAAFRFEFPQRMIELILAPSDDGNGNGLADTIEVRVAVPSARAYLIAANQASPDSVLNYEPISTEITDLVTARWSGGSSTADFNGTTYTFDFQGHNSVTQSSALLYYTLVTAGSFGAGAIDADRFTNEEVKDTDDDGLPEFVDAWGEPLRFYRWPTRLVDFNPPVPFQPILTLDDPTDINLTPGAANGQREIMPQERLVASLMLKGLPPRPSSLPNGALPRDLLLTDPDDPVGRLYSELERLDGTNGTPLFRNEFNEANYHTPDTFHTPLIVSAGPDGVVGLFELADTANLGNLAAIHTTNSVSAVI